MKSFSCTLGLLLTCTSLFAQISPSKAPDALMLRFPDISADRIVFVYAGDLWTVARTGGLAQRLSSPKGQEQFPRFSPDGRWIAFSGNYDGNTDVYVMPAEGGTPQRLTHHSATDWVVDWYPDGQHILFRSRMASSSNRFNRFFKQPVAGGLPEPLPLAYGELGSFSSDGSKLAFQFLSRERRNWKRYRGGMKSGLWIYDFEAQTSEKFAESEGSDAVPMWHGETIYFLSDRGEHKRRNIWAYDLKTHTFRQITAFSEYDVKWPSLGPDAVVFENGGRLYVLDLSTEKAHPISVRVPADLPGIRVQQKDAFRNIQSFSVSPSGKRALFAARGEVFTVPAEHGSVRNLTNTSGAAERYPSWSPDGKHIAYFSDRTGEYELYLHPSDGKGKARQITKDGKVYRYAPSWSPDSKKIAFGDKTGSLYVLNVSDGKPRFVDKDPWTRILHYDWSSDSRWLTYYKHMPNTQGAIMIYDTEKGKIHQVTGDFYHDAMPVFDPEGQYLYFYSDRTFNPIYGDMDRTWVYPNATNLYAVTLRKDVESPIAPRSDEEEIDKKKKDKDEDDDKKKDEKKKEKEKAIQIDFDGIETRVIRLPITVKNAGELRAVKGKVLFRRQPPAGASEPKSALIYYDLKEREEKTVISNISAFTLSADGKKVLYRSGSTYGIIDLKAGKKVGDGKINTDKIKAWIDPSKEWRQIFHEAWRVERDYFYDPNMHGLDWDKVRDRYAALLPYVVDREDLNYVIGEMIAELNASHTYVGGGDMERPERISVGLLGCDFELDIQNRMYRIKKIYQGADWDADVRSPLRQPGLQVQEGDYLLAVNGHALDIRQDPWAAFQGLAGEVVTLTVNSDPTFEGAREVTVKPSGSESRLRNLAWIEANRRKVENATGGRVGYIYVPNTGRSGQNELVRQFVPQHTKEALIIDERFNSGGQIPDRFIELLNRPTYNFWARHDHLDSVTPYLSHSGPKVMLINQWAGSGGDALPDYFRKAGLGPLVGKRTWGGLIGYSGNPRPIDGGFLTAPSFGYWGTDGKWAIEGYGIDPDYEVENLPHELAAGRDAQLEKAIEVILNLLEKNPPRKLKKPPYPDRSK